MCDVSTRNAAVLYRLISLGAPCSCKLCCVWHECLVPSSYAFAAAAATANAKTTGGTPKRASATLFTTLTAGPDVCRMGQFSFYLLVPRHTPAYSLLANSALCCRFGPPLAFNFMAALAMPPSPAHSWRVRLSVGALRRLLVPPQGKGVQSDCLRCSLSVACEGALDLIREGGVTAVAGVLHRICYPPPLAVETRPAAQHDPQFASF